MKRYFILSVLLLCTLSGFGQLPEGIRKVAVLEVVDREDRVDYATKLMLRSTLAAAITNTPGYEGYDRVDISQIMGEQNFQRTGMVSDAQIKKLGEIAGVSYILVAEAAKFPDGHLFITAKILNVESAKLESTSNMQSGTTDRELDEACAKLSASLLHRSSESVSPVREVSEYAQGRNQTFTANGIDFKMIYVQGGTFDMGATSEQEAEAGNDEKPVHQVTLDAYYIGEYEVTQALWQAVMGTTVCQQRDKINDSWPILGIGDDYPMYYVNYTEAQDFCSCLNRLLGDRLQGGRFALPTEAQWEYAARGGNKGKAYKYSGSNDVNAIAWYGGNSEGTTHPVGKKAPNELGLYDMSGNVWEWCRDWYGSYRADSQTNPERPDGSDHLLRGGCWRYGARDCRVSGRRHGAPDYSHNRGGFRLALLP